MGYELATPRQAIAHCSVWRLTDGERQHFPKHALLLSSIPRVFIYNFSFQYTRWGAISPEGCVPVLMLRTDCSFFALRYAHSSRLLPPVQSPVGNLGQCSDKSGPMIGKWVQSWDRPTNWPADELV